MAKSGTYKQAEMARELGVSQPTVSRELKRGRTRQLDYKRNYYEQYIAASGARVYKENRENSHARDHNKYSAAFLAALPEKVLLQSFPKNLFYCKIEKKDREDRVMNHFKGKQFKKDVIIVAVGYYLRYNLSYREVQELLYDRGINVCHTTIYRWVQEYSKVLYYLWKKKNRQSFYSWKMDETYIKIKGRWHYLYRAIDADGLTLDIWLRKKRDTQAAYAFLKRLHKQFGEPKAIVTDKAPSLGSAFRKLQSVGLYTKTEHRTVKYLNNLIEQDHRLIKRRNKFYQSLRTASSTIKGMETLRGIYKKNRRNGTLFGFSVSTEIKVLMGIPA